MPILKYILLNFTFPLCVGPSQPCLQFADFCDSFAALISSFALYEDRTNPLKKVAGTAMCLEPGSSPHCGCLAPRCLYVCMIQNLQFFQKGIHLLFFSLRNMQRPFLSFKTLSAGRRRKKTSYENKNIS